MLSSSSRSLCSGLLLCLLLALTLLSVSTLAAHSDADAEALADEYEVADADEDVEDLELVASTPPEIGGALPSHGPYTLISNTTGCLTTTNVISITPLSGDATNSTLMAAIIAACDNSAHCTGFTSVQGNLGPWYLISGAVAPVANTPTVYQPAPGGGLCYTPTPQGVTCNGIVNGGSPTALIPYTSTATVTGALRGCVSLSSVLSLGLNAMFSEIVGSAGGNTTDALIWLNTIGTPLIKLVMGMAGTAGVAAANAGFCLSNMPGADLLSGLAAPGYGCNSLPLQATSNYTIFALSLPAALVPASVCPSAAEDIGSNLNVCIAMASCGGVMFNSYMSASSAQTNAMAASMYSSSSSPPPPLNLAPAQLPMGAVAVNSLTMACATELFGTVTGGVATAIGEGIAAGASSAAVAFSASGSLQLAAPFAIWNFARPMITPNISGHVYFMVTLNVGSSFGTSLPAWLEIDLVGQLMMRFPTDIAESIQMVKTNTFANNLQSFELALSGTVTVNILLSKVSPALQDISIPVLQGSVYGTTLTGAQNGAINPGFYLAFNAGNPAQQAATAVMQTLCNMAGDALNSVIPPTSALPAGQQCASLVSLISAPTNNMAQVVFALTATTTQFGFYLEFPVPVPGLGFVGGVLLSPSLSVQCVVPYATGTFGCTLGFMVPVYVADLAALIGVQAAAEAAESSVSKAVTSGVSAISSGLSAAGSTLKRL